jgi:cystathionine beta-lyase
MDTKGSGFNTRCVHAGNYRDGNTGGVNTPVFTSTSYVYPNPSGEAIYPRYYNIPTTRAVAAKICDLEGGEEGLVLGSGMAAITSVLFALLKTGDHAVFHRYLYGGTHHFVASELHRYGIETSFAEGESAEDFRRAIKDNTRLIFFETPSNPLMKIIDLAEVSRLARERGILTIIDNTFATPLNQNPIGHGIDIVVHSGTKYLGGHSDINCGAVATSRKLMARIKPVAINHGGTLDVRACYLLERSLKTLGLRIERQNQNALGLAGFLEDHPVVREVHYPGLASNPGRDIAKRQMRGFGGMLSFEPECGPEAARKAVERLRLITPAVSLGGVESLICFPSETSHARMSPAEKAEAGISDTLIRLSVGIEDLGDLKEDLGRALDLMKKGR